MEGFFNIWLAFNGIACKSMRHHEGPGNVQSLDRKWTYWKSSAITISCLILWDVEMNCHQIGYHQLSSELPVAFPYKLQQLLCQSSTMMMLFQSIREAIQFHTTTKLGYFEKLKMEDEKKTPTRNIFILIQNFLWVSHTNFSSYSASHQLW